ncbi:MAG: response regulator [Thermodesulfobacteriota bacterium]
MSEASVLVVEDDESNLKLVRFVLEQSGYRVRAAADADAALDALRTFKPALILMDVQLPGIDGLELTRRLKAREDLRDVVVVALTAHPVARFQHLARAAGCAGCLGKPIDTRALPDQLTRFLRGAPALAS